MAHEARDETETTNDAEQETRRGYLVGDGNAKQVDDLQKYYPWMVRRARLYVPHYDAEQVANAALCDAHTPGRDRPASSEVPRIKLWLGELIEFRAKAYWKDKRKLANEVLYEDVGVVAHAQTVDLEKQIADRQCIRMMLDGLPRERRDAFLACTVDGVPVKQVAREHGVKENTVYAWIHFTRIELRAKWEDLSGTVRKRIALLFPFLFIRRIWRRIVVSAQRAQNQQARAAGTNIAGLVAAAATVILWGFAPSRPPTIRNENLAVPIQAANGGEFVVPAIRHAEISGSTGISRTSQTVVAPRITKHTPSDEHSYARSTTNEPSLDPLDEALLLRARAAYNKGNYARVNALLDEHEATFPKSRFAELRAGLREISGKAVMAVRP